MSTSVPVYQLGATCGNCLRPRDVAGWQLSSATIPDVCGYDEADGRSAAWFDCERGLMQIERDKARRGERRSEDHAIALRATLAAVVAERDDAQMRAGRLRRAAVDALQLDEPADNGVDPDEAFRLLAKAVGEVPSEWGAEP